MNVELPNIQIVSILDRPFVESEKQKGGYDIVHSWGVLHHTGNMKQALRNACLLVKEGGYLICAIYNKHWSSPFWKGIKWGYNVSPERIQQAFIALFYPLIYLAKWLVTGKNPKNQERGMDFYYDVSRLGGRLSL